MGRLNFLKNKRVRLALLIVFLLTTLVQAISNHYKTTEWRITLDSATSALEAGDYEKAEERFLKALEFAEHDFKDPKQWLGYAGLQNAYYMQGLAAHEIGEYEKGQELLLKALAVHREILIQFLQKQYIIPHPSPRLIEPRNILNWLFVKARKANRLEEAKDYLTASIALEEKRPGFQFGSDGLGLINHEVLYRDLGQIFAEQKDIDNLDLLVESCRKWNYMYALRTLEPELKELKSQM